MMQTTNKWRVMGWLVCLAAGCALFPVLSRANLNRPATTSVKPTAVLGVTPTKALQVVPQSVRDPNFPHALARDATGDTYGAAGLIQDAATAFFLDDLPDDHTFGTGDESAGANLLSNVDTRIVGTDFGPGVPGTNLIQVNYFTVDGSDLVPAGSLSPDGLIFVDWRLDVGSSAASLDKIEWTPNPGFTVVDSGFCVFDDVDGPLGCFPLTLDDSSASGVSGVGIVGLGGTDIAGFALDELVLFWEIRFQSCGDGNLDAGEECDDGNVIDGDGCSSTCTIENLLAGDIDGDGDVDLFDLSIILANFAGPGVP